MFEQLQALPTDPILGLSQAYAQDPNPQKVDLGVGVYKNELAETPVLASIRTAQEQLHQQEQTKAYQGPAGNQGFNHAIQRLIFADFASNERVNTLQTPGGCGALRVAAELINRCRSGATIWVSTPTWANHIPLLSSAGLTIREYPYYEAASQSINFDAMVDCLSNVPAGDLVLLHGCCHNPCGTDLSEQQWLAVADLAERRGFIPFIDLAYQGFGDGLDEDAFGIRLLVNQLPEVIVASSCSKNFGLYRERTGAISIVGDSGKSSANAFSQMQGIARGIYSMPPAHGAALVEKVLTSDSLQQQWESEVAEMRTRIKQLREDLSGALSSFGDFSFIARQRGMFSFLGLTEQQVQRLKDEHSVYMVNSSRVNIAGINQKNINYLAHAIASVL